MELTGEFKKRLQELYGIESVQKKLQALINKWKITPYKHDAQWERSVLDTLSPYRHDNIGHVLDGLIETIVKDDMAWQSHLHGPAPLSLYEKQNFNSFIDFFTRKLSDETYNKIKKESEKCNLIIPNECYIESFGKVNSDLSTIIRLKKPTENFLKNLDKQYNINLKGYDFINMCLLLSYYHRIHCPINGTIKSIITIDSPNEFFGDNMIWIVEFENDEFGKIYLFLIGESVVQDFEFKKSVGDKVNIFEELGNFAWGSQTFLFYMEDKFGDKKTEIKDNNKPFVGDKIF